MSENQTLKTIFSRASYRGIYKKTAVSREDLTVILKAGIAAPSGCNRQTVSFIAVDEEELLNQIKELFPRPSCKTAPALVLVFTKEIPGADGYCYNVQDYGAAIQNMLLAIKSMGYETCWYEGNIRACADQIAKLVNAPKDLKLVCLLPVGIPAEPAVPKSGKKTFEERAWFNRFDDSLSE